MTDAGNRLVLVVDDDATIRQTLVEALSEAPGLSAIGAASGVEVIDVLASRRPDLVVVDLDMPDMDGAEVAAWLRGDAATRDVPLIGITALPTWAGMRRDARAAGCEEIVDKPFDLDALVERIRRMLEDADRHRDA